MKMLDELDMVLDSTKQALDYDLITLNNRRKLIEHELNLFSRFNKDTFTLELGNKLTKYKEIGKVYKQFINAFDGNFNKMKILEKQSATLRNSVEDNKLTKEEFKKFYNDELNTARVLLRKAGGDSQLIPEVEPEFQRLSVEVEKLLWNIAKTNEQLLQIMKDEYSD